MAGPAPTPPVWRRALVAGLAATAAALGVAAAVLLADVRGEATGSAGSLAATVRASPASGVPARLAERLAGPDTAARVTGPGGDILAQAGRSSLWESASAPWYSSIAMVGADRGGVLSGAVEAVRPLAGGRTLTVRRALPPGVAEIGRDAALAALVAALLAGLATGLAILLETRRRRARIASLTASARVIAAGSGSLGTPPQGDLAPLSEALLAVRDRMADVQAVADAKVDTAEAAIIPLPLPAVARTPAGRQVGNPALAQLLDAMAVEDRDALVAALDALLSAGGRPSGRRVETGDGRALDVEAWPIPGGRIAAVSDRTEDERMRRLHRQISGAAARHLRAPIADIRATATELYSHVPAPSGPSVERILASADRMERLVGSMLRGSDNDPRARRPLLAPIGVAGLLWSLAQKWDRALRPEALRVELDLEPELPPALADAALVEEILTELIGNAAKFTPRGGTVRLVGRRTGEGVALEVQDTGDGIARAEAALVTRPFFRGQRSEVLPGAGLGLGVARALAERIGARLVVHGGPGGRVCLELPAAPAAQAAVPAVSASAA